MFWGNFLQSLMIVSLANLIEFNRQESKTYFHINKELATEKSFHSAANLIKSFFKYLLIKKKDASSLAAKKAEFDLKI